jgi:uncharacterized membrane protein YfcA
MAWLSWACMSIEAMIGIALGVFLIAFAFAPVGMGGGMLFVPLLHYGAGWEIDGRIIAASLTLTAVVSYGSGLAHRREGHVDDAIVKTGLYGAIPGAIVGVFIVSLIGEHLDDVFKLLSLVMIIWAIRKSMTKMKQVNPQKEIEANGQIEEVPILRTFGHLAPRRAIGSSLHFMMAVIPISILTHVAFLPSDSIEQLTSDVPFIVGLALLTFLGARSGAHFGMKHLSEARIMQLFLGLIIIVAIRYIIDLGGF